MPSPRLPLSGEKELYQQGKNLESSTNKRSIHVKLNGDAQSEQQSAIFGTNRSQWERQLQGSITFKQNTTTISNTQSEPRHPLHKQSPQQHPYA
jgi:hypothetical protein